jgi:adenosylcobinamide-GDP ribazoletransferase
MNLFREYLLAVQFFTRIPLSTRVANWAGFTPEMLCASAAHLPGVGILVGLIAATVLAGVVIFAAATPYTPVVAASLSTAATVLLTGAFHEDGLADVADGLGGGRDKEQALRIMKDSRIGVFGAVALVLALVLKIGLVASLSTWGWEFAGAALTAGHVFSRAGALVPIKLLPYISGDSVSKSKPLAEAITAGALGVAAAWVCAVAASLVAMDRLHAADIGACMAASTLATAWMVNLFRRRLQGFTGDCLGATQQVCELTCYLSLLLVHR